MCFIAQAQQKRPLRAGRLAVAGDRNFRGLSQQRRIFPSEHLGAEPHGCIDLRLPETAIGIAGMAQSFEQCPGAIVQVIGAIRLGRAASSR